MYNNKFILEDGTDLFPGYLDKEGRCFLKDRYKGKREYMKCGCKPNGELFYRISEDLKIYPEHNNYKHDMLCSRYQDEDGKKTRQVAYLIDEESGDVTTYLSFDLKEFNLDESVERERDNEVPEESEDTEEIIVEADDVIRPDTRPREPKLSLKELIRSINVDTFTEKVLTGKSISSAESFQKMVFYRMKKVGVNRSKRAIGDLTLEKDGVRFVYLPFAGSSTKEEKGFKRCYIQTKAPDGKIYSNFTYPEILESAIKVYREQYGEEPNLDTMLAGFQYLKKGRSGTYRVLGRVHLFETSDIGLYCESILEQQAFNILDQITEKEKDIKYWIPPEDKSVGAYVSIKGYKKKILLLFKGMKSQRVSYDRTAYVPLVVTEDTILSSEMLRCILENE